MKLRHKLNDDKPKNDICLTQCILYILDKLHNIVMFLFGIILMVLCILGLLVFLLSLFGIKPEGW